VDQTKRMEIRQFLQDRYPRAFRLCKDVPDFDPADILVELIRQQVLPEEDMRDAVKLLEGT
jgi:hypothetical protein